MRSFFATMLVVGIVSFASYPMEISEGTIAIKTSSIFSPEDTLIYRKIEKRLLDLHSANREGVKEYRVSNEAHFKTLNETGQKLYKLFESQIGDLISYYSSLMLVDQAIFLELLADHLQVDLSDFLLCFASRNSLIFFLMFKIDRIDMRKRVFADFMKKRRKNGGLFVANHFIKLYFTAETMTGTVAPGLFTEKEDSKTRTKKKKKPKKTKGQTKDSVATEVIVVSTPRHSIVSPKNSIQPSSGKWLCVAQSAKKNLYAPRSCTDKNLGDDNNSKAPTIIPFNKSSDEQSQHKERSWADVVRNGNNAVAKVKDGEMFVKKTLLADLEEEKKKLNQYSGHLPSPDSREDYLEYLNFTRDNLSAMNKCNLSNLKDHSAANVTLANILNINAAYIDYLNKKYFGNEFRVDKKSLPTPEESIVIDETALRERLEVNDLICWKSHSGFEELDQEINFLCEENNKNIKRLYSYIDSNEILENIVKAQHAIIYKLHRALLTGSKIIK